MVAHLFLYPDRRLQIRLESGIADCRSFSGNQFAAVRNASSGSASRHSVEVRITGGSSRLGGTPLQPHLSAYFIGRRTVYQVAGTLGEWVMVGSFFQAVQDFRIGLPGMAMQVAGGYALIKYSASL